MRLWGSLLLYYKGVMYVDSFKNVLVNGRLSCTSFNLMDSQGMISCAIGLAYLGWFAHSKVSLYIGGRLLG